MPRNRTTLADLLMLLEDYAAEYGDDTPVQLQYQPSYPLKADIAGITCAHDIETALTEEQLAEDDPDFDTSESEWPDPPPVIYILATESVDYDEHPYGNRIAWEVARR